MKIKKNHSSVNHNRTSGLRTGKGQQNFFRDKLAEIEQQQLKQRLDKLLVIVDQEGERLKKTLAKRDLFSYKKRVQDFLKILQQEFVRPRKSFSWDENGNVKSYTLIEKIDRNLDILQGLFLQEQSTVLNIVKKIDEIRGLLMDLYI